jgi:Na+-driven multidrug efflux pump
MMFYLALNEQNPVYIRIRQIFIWRSKMVARIFRIAIPNSVENGLFQISKVALSSMVAMEYCIYAEFTISSENV